MNVQILQQDNLSYVVIDDMYCSSEVEQINKELWFLETIKQPANLLNSAIENGVALKTGYGIFLDEVYANRNFSAILKANRKLFSDELNHQLCKHSCFYDHIGKSTTDSTLINFYGSSENYLAHRDKSVFTALTFFKLGEFSGGDLSFPEYGISIDPVVGRTVIFPGCVLHQAEPTVAAPGNYRVTMAQFFGYA